MSPILAFLGADNAFITDGAVNYTGIILILALIQDEAKTTHLIYAMAWIC